MIKIKKGKAKGSQELRKLYTDAVNGKEEYSYLAPNSYTESDLVENCKVNKKLFRPLVKSFGLI